MARKVKVLLIDDLNGNAADETVTFAVDGVSYEIDLSIQNAEALRRSLAPYLAAGRRVGRVTAPPKAGRATSGATSNTTGRRNNQAIRDWAKAQGLAVSHRGRVPAEIVEKYHAAGSPQ